NPQLRDKSTKEEPNSIEQFERAKNASDLLNEHGLYWVGQHYGVGASPPAPVPRLHGERIVDGLLFGEASRIGSTPPSRVMTVGTPLAPPSVATIMTASPFCRSEERRVGKECRRWWAGDR